jgi:tetratricopeptide (TPR) repeat protein
MNAPLLLLIGRCYEGLNDTKKALKQYEQALFINEKFTEAYVTRANLYSNIGDMSRCIEDYKEAMKHDPNPRIRLLLADLYLRAYNVDAAKKLYNEILASQNKEHQKEAFAGLGIINYITDDFPKAIIDFSNALKLDPENTDLLAKRANCFLSIGNWDRALQDSEKAITLKKDLHLAYLTRAQCYFHKREYLKAANDFSFFLTKEEEEFKKVDAQAPSADNTAAYEEQKFDVLITKAMCYWYRDIIQRGYDPEGDFGSHTQANWKNEPAKEISAARLTTFKELLQQIKDANLLEVAMADYLLANKNPNYRERMVQYFDQFQYVLETVYRRPVKPAKHVNIKQK